MTFDPKTGASASRLSAGFTLAELLIVISIIALLVAITVPALGGARVAARKTATKQLMSSFTQASGSFYNDNDRAPGLFTAAEMGHFENADSEGMSAMENAILDLSGQDAVYGRVPDGDPAETGRAIKVGPLADPDSKYWVKPDLIATNKDAYFTASPQFFKAQLRETQQFSTSTDAGHAELLEEDPQMPDVIDAFGQPLLLWVEDVYGPAKIDQNASDPDLERLKFVTHDSSTDGSARFYWASNAAFLKATELGKKGFDMNADPLMGKASIIGQGVIDAIDEEELGLTMAALLGNPGFKELNDINGMPYTPSDLLPETARGKLLVHSAGPDGIYLSNKDKGMSQAAADLDHIEYGTNYYIAGSPNGDPENRHLDDKGAPTSVNIIDEFDDLVVGD